MARSPRSIRITPSAMCSWRWHSRSRRAIEDKSALVVEAGTGVGKTYAYLVPALLSGARTLLSTATKTLQDQLFVRDLPRLRSALKLPVSVALLKGRSSYLCLHRLGQARHDAYLPDRFAVRALAKVEAWAQTTASGDIAELEGLDERSSVIPLVTSSRENCLGSECPDYRSCHVMKARREAMLADVVVVNHHLFFADMTLRDSGVAELLPSVELAIFDEAHQLGRGRGAVSRHDARLGAADRFRTRHARGRPAAGARTRAVAGARRGVRSRRARAPAGGQRHDRRCPRQPQAALVRALGRRCVSGRARARRRKRGGRRCSARHGERDRSRLRPPRGTRRRLAELAGRFAARPAAGLIRWIDLLAHQARLVESPLDIRAALREQMAKSSKAWIFTSATLGDDERLSWFTEPAGLDDARVVRLGSPFDYAAHARVFVPRVFAKPNEPGHAIAVAGLAGRCARALGGRTFVLTTTLRSLQAVGAQLRNDFDAGGDAIEVLVQGQGSKRQLMQRFLEAPHAVLVGSQSFWEGVDVPGEALQCVVIDKLPFPPPNDPLVEARVQRLEGEGRNAFAEYFVAEAAVALKQGAGRLIRSESDRGLLVVCDPRMATMGYGRRLFAALAADATRRRRG